MIDPVATRDFFISYALADRAWAEWIAWQLEEAEYRVKIQAWDFLPGSNFVFEMQKATVECERTIVVFSPNYFLSEFTKAELAAAFAQDPTGKKQKLIPVRIADCELTGILAPIVYLDLVGLPEEDARAALLGGFSTRNKPVSAPVFPGVGSPQAPDVSSIRHAYPGATAISSQPAEISILSNIAESADQSRQLSASECSQFLPRLFAASPRIFNILLFAVKPPFGVIPPMPFNQVERTIALLEWAGSRGGCGLPVLQELLSHVEALEWIAMSDTPENATIRAGYFKRTGDLPNALAAYEQAVQLHKRARSDGIFYPGLNAAALAFLLGARNEGSWRRRIQEYSNAAAKQRKDLWARVSVVDAMLLSDLWDGTLAKNQNEIAAGYGALIKGGRSQRETDSILGQIHFLKDNLPKYHAAQGPLRTILRQVTQLSY